MSRAILYCTICLILTTFAPVNHNRAAALEPPAGSWLTDAKDSRISQPDLAYVVEGERLSDTDAADVEAASENSEKNPVQVPLPSTVWLMAGGLVALILIKRRERK